MLQSLLAFLKSYRESGFMNAKIIANNLAKEIEVEPVVKKTRPRKKKKNFDYEGNDERIIEIEINKNIFEKQVKPRKPFWSFNNFNRKRYF